MLNLWPVHFYSCVWPCVAKLLFVFFPCVSNRLDYYMMMCKVQKPCGLWGKHALWCQGSRFGFLLWWPWIPLWACFSIQKTEIIIISTSRVSVRLKGNDNYVIYQIAFPQQSAIWRSIHVFIQMNIYTYICIYSYVYIVSNSKIKITKISSYKSELMEMGRLTRLYLGNTLCRRGGESLWVCIPWVASGM